MNGEQGAAKPTQLTPMTADQETLRCQLEQLNERARWYATQLWQLPLAFIGLAGVGLGGVIEKNKDYLPGVFTAIWISGFAILFHMVGLHGGIRRAVRNIRRVEDSLKLEKTAEYYPLYSFPLQILILLVADAAGLKASVSIPCGLPLKILCVAGTLLSLWLFWKARSNSQDNA